MHQLTEQTGKGWITRVTEWFGASCLHPLPALKSLGRPGCVMERPVLFLTQPVTRNGPPVPEGRVPMAT